MKICLLCHQKRNTTSKSHWSHACSGPKAAANGDKPHDLREVEHGLPHVRDVHFFKVLEGLHCREGAISWWVREPCAQHPGQRFHYRIQLWSLWGGRRRKNEERNWGICALQLTETCLQLGGGEDKTPQEWSNAVATLFSRAVSAPRCKGRWGTVTENRCVFEPALGLT